MSFYRAVVTVGGFTLGSRVLGFLRDIMTAAFMGAGPVADAFFVALKLPNFFRRVTAEGAFSVSFVPLFAGELEVDGKEAAKKFAEEAQAVMLAALIPFTVIVIAAMPWVLYLVAPGFGDTPERYQMALEMSRISFPYILLMSLTALLGGVLNSFDRFGPFAAAPMLFNACLMAALGAHHYAHFAPTAGHAMAWGVFAAGVLQLVWLAWSCRRLGMGLRLRRPALTPMIRKLFRKMGPGVMGAGVAQVNLFVDMILASLLPVGSISFLYYADRLYQLPLSVIGTATGTALLPMLTRALRGGDTAGAHRLFLRAVEVGLWLVLPATLAYLVMAPDIMSVLFQRGHFTADDSVKSAWALMAYSIGLPAFIFSKIFGASFYAREDTTTPVKIAIICAVVNTVLCLVLMYMTPLKHVGIALATGISAWISAGLLARALWKEKFFRLDSDSGKRLGIVLLSVAVMGGVLFAEDKYAMPYFMKGGQALRLLGLAGVMSVAGLVYVLCLYAGGILKPSYLKELFPKGKKKDTIGDVQKTGQ
ncbi:MAG: murein biosynthesis integral membrane protein MurJ [Alphaproteobacteria bacterium]|nr:murein biosynthesis integral membrane protein MurJ [Alphaproteobacteria bacterium]